MLKMWLPCLLLAVVATHLVLVQPALSLHLPLWFKTIQATLSLACLLALCTYGFTYAAAVAFCKAHHARWLIAVSGGLIVAGLLIGGL